MLHLKSGVSVAMTVAVLGAAQGATAAQIVLSDADPSVASGNWALEVDPAYPLAGLYVINSGNSQNRYDASGFLIHQFPHSEVANVAWGLGERYTLQTVTPSADGPIATVDYSMNVRKGSPDGVRVALMLIQDGKYYRSDFATLDAGPNTPLTTVGEAGLTALDFGEFVAKAYKYDAPVGDGTANFASNPDFSASGSEIRFGYLAHYDSALNDLSASPAAYLLTDAWSATINTVPEPASAALIAVSSLLLLRRRA